MAKQFKGKIAVDIRDSTPDWEPYLAPKAPEGAPNVLFLAWDDLGYAHDGRVRRPGRVPEHAQARGSRCEVGELPHHRAVLADARVAVDGTQRDVERHGHDRGVRLRVPRHLDAYPVRERLHLRGARRERLQHVLRRQVASHAGRGVQPRGVQGPLAARPRLRALLRLARRRDQQLVSRPGPRQPPDRRAGPTRGRLPRRRRPRGHRDHLHPRREGDRSGQAVLHVPRAPGRSRAAPGADGMDRQVQGQVRRGLRGDPRRDPRAARSSSDCSRTAPNSPTQPARRARTHRPRRSGLARSSTRCGRGTR